MPREILFRGFHEDKNGTTTIIVDSKEVKGEWIYGYYWLNDTVTRQTVHITDNDGNTYIVIPSTVGQYTGLNDKNGKKIFEGDKAINIGDGVGIVRFGTAPKNLGWNGTGHLAFYVEFDSTDLRRDLPYWAGKSEVTGTIFDKEVAKCD